MRTRCRRLRPEGHPYSDSDACPNAYANPDSDSGLNRDTYADANSYTNPNRYGCPVGYRHSNADPNTKNPVSE